MFDTPSSPAPPTTSGKPGLGLGEYGDSMFSANPAGATLPIPPTAAAPPPMFGAQGTTAGKRPSRKPTGTFMGGGSITPNANQLGGNTLLGQ